MRLLLCALPRVGLCFQFRCCRFHHGYLNNLRFMLLLFYFPVCWLRCFAGFRAAAAVLLMLLDRIQVDTDVVSCEGDIVIRLQLHPVGGFVVEIPGKAHSSVGGDGAFTQHDFVDAPGRNLYRAREPVLAQVSGL